MDGWMDEFVDNDDDHPVDNDDVHDDGLVSSLFFFFVWVGVFCCFVGII